MSENALRLLLVDDDPVALAQMQRLLAGSDREILTAAHGRQALQIMIDTPVPLVITDWSMPEMNGIELIRALRTNKSLSQTHVMVVTANSEEERLVEAFEAGADGFLAKPYREKELLSRVRAAERMVRRYLALQSSAHGGEPVSFIPGGRLASPADDPGQFNTVEAVDVLTGLPNRHTVLTRLQEQWALAQRRNDPLACFVVDLDHFQPLSDRIGRARADVVLKSVAVVLQQAVRRGETLARIGGTEFLVICPQSTEDMATVGAERIRLAVERNRGGENDVTVSIGVAERTWRMSSIEDLLRAAHDALQAAKKNGCNAVRTARSTAESVTKATEDGSELEKMKDARKIHRERENGIRVMIVDENGDLTRDGKRILGAEGYEIVETTGAPDALRKTAMDRLDVLVVDTALKEIGMLDFLRKLKGDPATSNTPVIVALSERGGWELSALLAAGADDFVAQPIVAEEFTLRVRNMVRFSRELTRSNGVRGEQSRALELFLTFSREVAGAASLDEILDATVMSTASLLSSRRVCILLPDTERAFLRVACHLGLPEGTVEALSIPVGSWIAGESFAKGNSVVLTPGSESNPGTFPDYVLFPGTPSICAPLVAPEGIVGILTVSGRRDAQPFEELDLEYVDLVCNMAAAAIEDSQSRQARDEARDSIVVALARLAETRDADTGKHLDRVTQFCRILAEQLRSQEGHRGVIDDEFLADLARAVPLHDIGKVAVPDRILQKPGRLTSDEMAVMRTHAEIGARTIRTMRDQTPGARFLLMAEQIAQGHHEWFDGSGYPAGTRAEQIPLPARIAALADVYDALTTCRVYKRACTHAEAAATIVASTGRQFDPDVVAAFIRSSETFARLARELADEFPGTRFRRSSRSLPRERPAPALHPTSLPV